MTKRVVTDVAELVNLVQLSDIFLVELRAARLEDTRLPTPEKEIPVANQIFQRTTESEIEIRLISTVENELARFSADVVVQYTKLEEFDATDDALQDFTRRVGLMAGYPYIREAISDLSTKLRTPTITMSIVRPDDIKFSPIPADID